MAQVIGLKHSASGLTKKGFVGFSWTTFFFGIWPALFRGDFQTFLGSIVILFVINSVLFTATLAATTVSFAAINTSHGNDPATIAPFLLTILAGIAINGLPLFVWAFRYNQYYTRRLLEKGYVLHDTEEKVALVRLKLNIDA